MDSLLMYGSILIVITFLTGLKVAEPYREDNFQRVASTQRKLCIAYAIGFGAVAYGASMSFGGNWWVWVVIGISSMMGFGALLEAFKTLPNAPREMQKD